MAFRTSPCAAKHRSAAMWIEVTQPEAKKLSQEQSSEKEEIPILSLTHFAKTPWVCFGVVKLNTTKLKSLIIHNPTNIPQTIALEKLSSENGFYIEQVFRCVESDSEEVLEVRWTPEKCGNFRELVNFRVNRTYIKQVILLGTALAPTKILKERKKKPLEVIHPTNQTFVKPSRPVDGVLLTKKVVSNIVRPEVRKTPVKSNFLCKTSSEPKIFHNASHPICSSAASECLPPDLSLSAICADVSCDTALVFDSPTASEHRTPELLRAYRNRPKKTASTRRKSTYNVRLTPEGQTKNISEDARSPHSPTQPFHSSSKRSPTRIPIAVGRGSPAKQMQDSTNISKVFHGNVEYCVHEASRSTPDRRQTYVSASPTNVAFTNSSSVGLKYLESNKSGNHFEGAAASSLSELNSTPPPVDRRQTYVAGSPVASKKNSVFHPINDKYHGPLFLDIPDTPTRRETFIKHSPSQSDLPTVKSPVSVSWADQCEMLELNIINDSKMGAIPFLNAASYDVPYLERTSKVNPMTVKPSPKKSKLPRKKTDPMSKPDRPSNTPINCNVLFKNDPFSSPFLYRTGSSAFDKVDSDCDSSLVAEYISEGSVERFSNIENDKPRVCNDDGLQKWRPLTYRKNRYSDITEVDSNSETSCFPLSDSLEVLSPTLSERPVSLHTVEYLPSDSVSSDSLETLPPAILVEKSVTSCTFDHLPTTSPSSDACKINPSVSVIATTISEPPIKCLHVENTEESVPLVNEFPQVPKKQIAVNSSQYNYDAVVDKVAPGEMMLVSNSPLYSSHLNYDEFCQDLPVSAVLRTARSLICEDELHRCSTEVKVQPPKECFESEACKELFPVAIKKKVCIDSETNRAGTEAPDCDMRRISSETYIKTPECSKLELLDIEQQQGMVNDESDKIPAKRKSDEFCKDLSVHSAKRLKSFELVTETPAVQEKTLSKLKSNAVSSQNSSQTKSINRVMPPRLKLIKPPTPQTALAHHPNPFAAKNAYYDERWAEKQIQGFTRWLNFVLAMPDEFVMGEEAIVEHIKSMDVREVTCPSREVLSLREYRAGCSLNRLRRKACSFYQSREIVLVVNRVEAEIEKGQLLIRKDRALHADVGIRKRLLEIVMSYNSLWLRIGLETVFGVLIPLRNNNDSDGLSNFTVTYLLNSADIAKEYAHAVVPYLFKPGYAQALKKHTLKKFLLLVFFLDQAKEARLLQYNPCLFQKNALFKSSKELLLSFSKDYLHGEGNIIKHLSFLGYKVSVQQSYLDEYDFSVKNLAVDLRNGIRLVKVTELITHNWNLISQVRLPSESRLQKLHNVGLVFTAYKCETGYPLKDIHQKEIVDGHREKTLYLLWQMLYNLQISKLLDEKQLRKEITFLENSLNLRRGSSQGAGVDMELFLLSLKELYAEENLQLLLHWCHLVCAHFGVQVENFTVAFSDGRALCYLINYYFPLLLPLESIKLETTQTYCAKNESSGNTSYSSEDSFNSAWTTPALAPDKYESLLQNERSNLNLVLQKVVELGGIPLLLKANTVCNTIPDEKIMISFISFLWNRLWNLAAEVRAARTIQLVWRRRSLEHKKKQKLQLENRSAAILQRAFREYHLKKKQLSALAIQKAWRAYQERVKLHKAASKVQEWYRTYVRNRNDRILEEKIIRFQAIIRAYVVRSRIQEKLSEGKMKAATLIQASVRGFLCRKHYNILLGRIISLQAVCRGHRLRLQLKQELRSKENQHSSAVVIQAAFRGYVVRKRFKQMVKVILSLQSMGRGLLVRRQVQLQMAEYRANALARERAAAVIQRYLRALVQRRQKHHVSAMKIQTVYRGFIQHKMFTAKRAAVLIIQKWYRTCLEARKMHVTYLQQKRAAVVIQAYVRCWLIRKRYCVMKIAAMKIQMHYRTFNHKRSFRLTRTACIQIQTWFRSCLLQKKFCQTRVSVVKIQQWYRHCKRAEMDRNTFLKYKTAALKLQAYVRAFIVARRYRKMKVAAICIQAFYRRYAQRKKDQQDQSALKIQAAIRGYCQRKSFCRLRQAAKIIQQHYRRFLLMKVTRTEFISQRNGAIAIQAQTRMWLKRKEYTQKKKAAILIQAVVRGHLQRKYYEKVQHNINKIQDWYRSIKKTRRERLLFLQLKLNTIRIQSFFRMHLKCKKYKAMKLSAVKIQTVFRAYKLRKRFQQMKKNVVKLQTVYRGYVQRKNYVKKRCAAVQVQRWYLLLQQGKRERELFLQQRRSVIAIQALVRKWLAAQKYLRLKVAAIKIQSTVRRFLCKSRYRAIYSATLKIQVFFRAFQQRQNFLKMRQSAAIIQHWYRTRMDTKKKRVAFLNRKAAAIRIQAWFRMCCASNDYRKVQASVIRLQSCYRCYKQRKQYESYCCAATKIQTWYRNAVLAQHARQFYFKQKVAALLIQKWYKDIRSEQQLIVQRQTAAIDIQRWYRSCIVTKHQHQLFLQQRQAAYTIQQWYKNHIKSKSQRQIFLHQRNAGLTIQRWYRNCVIGKRQRIIFMHYKDSAVAIQRWYRNCVLGKTLQKSFLKQRAAVTTIKQWYKNCVLSRCQRKSFLHYRDAVVTIQRWYKNCIIRTQYNLFLNQRSAAICIQRWYRNYRLSRSQQKMFLMQRFAVVAIQRWYRNCVVGRSQRMIFLKQKNAAVHIQLWYKNCLVSRADRQQFLQYKYAAAVIQRWYRNCILSKYLQKSFLKQRAAVTTIKQWYKNCALSRCQRNSFLKSRDAVVTIQRWYKNSIIRRTQHNLFLNQRSAAICIQRWYRNYKLSRSQQKVFLMQRCAVVAIQRWYRNCVVGRSQRMIFLKQKNAAVHIQLWYKNCLVSRADRQQFLQYKYAAAVIQRWYRNCILSKYLRKSFLKQRAAVTTIKQWYKNCALSRRQRNSFLKCRDAVVTIQRWYKNSIIRRTQHNLFLNQRSAAICIQRWYRNYRLSRSQQKVFLMQRCAVVAIQRWYRNCVVGRSQRMIFLKQKKAAVHIQLWYKNCLVSRADFQQFLQYEYAAAVIQRWYRNCILSKYLRKSFLKQRAAVTTIKQWYKNCALSRCQRNSFLKCRDAVVTIQRWYKNSIIRRTQHNLFLNQRSAAICIQRWYRKYRLSRSQQKVFLMQRCAVVAIQRWYRNCVVGRSQRMIFLKQKKAAVHIQVWYKNCLVSRAEHQQFLQCKYAAVVIQQWYRNCVVSTNCRKSFLKQRTAAQAIQEWFRRYAVGKSQRKVYLRKKMAALVIQQWYRNINLSKCKRHAFLKKRAAVSTIQCWFRGYVVSKATRRLFLKRRRAALTIQKWFRACLLSQHQLKLFQSLRASTIVIQKWYRSCILTKHQRRFFLQLKLASYQIQQWYKLCSLTNYQRQSFLQQRNAARTIQRWYRNCVQGKEQRQLFLHYRDAALKIQQWYRSCTSTKHQQQLFLQYKKAALTIQQWYRNCVISRRQQEEFLHYRYSIIKIQACVRRWLAIRRCQQNNKAATLIQTCFRAYRQRKLYNGIKSRVIKTQAVVRACIQRRVFLEVRLAAILIQRWYRHCKHQKLMREEFVQRHLAAIVIQSYVRRFLVQKCLKSTAVAAVIIQQTFRQYIQRKHLEQKSAAAIKIQAKFRGWKHRRRFRKMKLAAVLIQARYRSFFQQKEFQRLRSSVIKIQALCRSLIVRRRFLDMRLAAVVIQRWFRFKRIGELLYLDHQWKLVAAIRIQAHVRGFLVRQQVCKMKLAATVIQTVYRQYRAHKQNELYCRNNYAATVIQTFYRAYAQRVSYLKTKCAAILIQRWFRCCRAHKVEKEAAAIRVQSYARMFISLTQYKKKRNSALIIQNAYRAHLQHHSFMKLKRAVVACQSLYRGRVQYKSYIRAKNAATLIQKWYRYYKLQQAQKQQTFVDNAAAVIIQSYVRMWLCVKQFKAFKEGSIVMQRAYRAHVIHQSFERQKLAAVIIQRWFRLLHVGNAERVKYLAFKKSIVKVQTYTRRWLVSKKYKQICFSACLIQASFRMYLCRKSYLQLKYATVMIQRWFRVTCEGCKARDKFLQIRSATVKIQTWYRSHVQRQLFLRICSSAVIIQSYCRGWSCRRDYQALKDVAVVIQRWYRNARESRYLRQTSAAVRIQAWARMCIARRRFLMTKRFAHALMSKLLQDRGMASSQQSIFLLGQSCNKASFASNWEQQSYLQCEERAAIIIQHWYRNIKHTYRVRRWYLITRGAILTIQAFYRGMKYRHNFLNSQRAAVVIQTAFRGWLLRQQHTARTEAAITIQQWWRRLRLSFSTQYDYLVMRGATILLQAWIRGTLIRRSYLIMRGACIVIQANWRGYLARHEYGVYRGAVLFIQCEFRRKLLFRRDLMRYHVMRGAAITIQAYVRGYIARKQTLSEVHALRIIQDEFNSDFQALHTITSNHFSSLSLEEQALFHVMRGAAITIQAWVRGWLVRQHVKRLLLATRCLTFYQLAYGHPQRLTSAGENYLNFSTPQPPCSTNIKYDLKTCRLAVVDKVNENSERERYIVKIQSFFRMWHDRKRYLEIRDAVIMIQVWYRRVFTKRKLAIVAQECRRWEAAGKIQHCWRRHRDIHLSKQLIKFQQAVAAAKIQNCWRIWQIQRRAAAVKIQRQWLALQKRREVEQLLDARRKAAIVIQTGWRNFLDRKNIQQRDEAARIIQSWIKRLLERRSRIIAEQLAIQNVRRAAYLEKFAFFAYYHLCIIRIQRAYRFYATHPNRKARSAVRIQDRSWYEVVPLGSSLRRAGSAVTTVASTLVTQAVWRGYKVRSASQDRRVSSARHRILNATQSATPDNTLWNRTISALDYLLHCRNLSTVLVAVNNLDVAVRLSSVCCRQLVEVGGVPVLYKLISGCNRSVPHIELINGIISVLLSLAKYDETMPAVWQEGKALEAIPELMRHFREKNPQILTKCCSLLWLLAQDPTCCFSMCQNCKFVEMIRSIHYLTNRKAQMEEQRYWQLASQKGHILPVCKTTPSKCQRKNPRIQPDWILGNGHMREFKDPISGLSALLTSLNVSPKRR